MVFRIDMAEEQAETNRDYSKWQPAEAEAGEINLMAASVLSRAQWAQRVLSPWLQKWLPTAGAPVQRQITPSGFNFQTAFAVSGAQRTVMRVQLQYRPPANPAAGSAALGSTLPASVVAFPLAGVPEAAERAAAPAGAPVGPYARPFNSLEEFLKELEAARERNYAPPTEAERPKPPPKREPGPYARPFNSLADFLKAVEAAQQQWGTAEAAPAQEPLPVAPAPPARIRPISHVEELPIPGQLSEFQASSPAESASPVQSAQPSTVIPPYSPPRAKAAASPQASAPQASAPPAVQRIPDAALSPATEIELPAPTPSVTASESSPAWLERSPIQQEAIEAAQISAATGAAVPVPVTLQSEAPTPRLDLPLAQRQVSEPSAAPSSDEIRPAPITEARPQPESMPTPSAPGAQPVVQQHATETQLSVIATTAPQPKAPTSQPEMPLVQRQVGEPTLVPSSEETPPALSMETQLQPESTPSVTPQAAPRLVPSIQPTVQRQAAESGAPSVLPQTSPVVSTLSQPEAPISRPDMPLAQRQVSEPAATLSVEETRLQPESTPQAALQASSQPVVQWQAPAVEASSVSPQTSPVAPMLPQLEAPISRPEMPLVQRQVGEPTLVPSSEETPSALSVETQLQSESIPQAASQAAPSAQSVVQRQTAESGAPSVSPQTSSVASTLPQPEAPIDRPEMPLVQRQVSEPMTAPSVEETRLQLESTPQAAPTLSQPEAPISRPDIPLVQRQAGEPTTTSSVEETRPALSVETRLQPESTPQVAPQTAPQVTVHRQAAAVEALVSRPDMPLVQRQAGEPAVTPSVEETRPALSVETRVQPESTPQVVPQTAPQLTVHRQAAAVEALINRPDMPLVQTQAGEPAVTPSIEETRPLLSADAHARSAPQSVLDMQPTMQRQAVEVKPPTITPAAAPGLKPVASDMPLVQRQVSEPSTAPGAGQRQLPETTLVQPVESPAVESKAQAIAPEMPLIQRKATDIPSDMQVQPASASAKPVELVPTLGQRITAQVGANEHPAAQRLPDLLLRRTLAPPEAEAEIGRGEQSGDADSRLAARDSVPARPAATLISQPAPVAVIQRLAEPSVTEPAPSGTIQRLETTVVPEPMGSTVTKEAATPADLDALARQIYPIIKRMLSVERERRAPR